MDDIDFAFMSEGEATSRYDLKADFYRYARFREYFWDGTSAIAAVRPLAFDRDRAETIRIQYGKNYYVIVEQGSMQLSGPHAARLFLYHKDYPDGLWLGTLQLDGAFYDDKGIKKQLRTAIKKRLYWAAPESDNEIIELKEPELIVELPAHEAIQLPLSHKKKSKDVIFHLKRFHKQPNRWGGIWWIIPKCPLCGQRRSSEAKMDKHLRIKHKRTGVFWKPSHLCPPWR